MTPANDDIQVSLLKSIHEQLTISNELAVKTLEVQTAILREITPKVRITGFISDSVTTSHQ